MGFHRINNRVLAMGNKHWLILILAMLWVGLYNSPIFKLAPVPVTYYVSPTGSDSNPGTSKASPWQTLSKVNGSTFNPGDIILLEGGKSFTGSLSFTVSSWTGASSSTPVTIGHYGTGRPTINSSSTIGFLVQNNSGFILRGINFVGSGITANTAHGINIDNSQAGNTKLDYVFIDSVTVSSYGGNGIFISSSAGTSGFSNVTLQNDTAHDCTGGIANGGGSAGIFVCSNGPGYGSGSTTPCSTNVIIQNCVAYNNTGKTGDVNWVGSGIVLGEVGIGLIQHCTAYNNGENSTNSGGGPVGIWFFDSTTITMQFNESYSNKTGHASADGDGFDVDGGNVNCIVQYNYSHNNAGAGFQIYTYNDGLVTGTDSIIVRYNISVDDGPNSSQYLGNLMLGNDGGNLTRIYVYNNTFYQSGINANSINIGFEGGNANSITGLIANNICYSASGTYFIFTGTTPIMRIVGNDYYTTGTPNYQWNGTSYTTFASWQTASGAEKILGVNVGKTVNPLLVSPGTAGAVNYKLQNISPVSAAGLNLMSLYTINPGTQDYFLNAIPNSGGNYSIGAHQPTRFTGRIFLN